MYANTHIHAYIHMSMHTPTDTNTDINTDADADTGRLTKAQTDKIKHISTHTHTHTGSARTYQNQPPSNTKHIHAYIPHSPFLFLSRVLSLKNINT